MRTPALRNQADRRAASARAVPVVVEGRSDEPVLGEPVELDADPLGGIGEVEVPPPATDLDPELRDGLREAGTAEHIRHPALPVVGRGVARQTLRHDPSERGDRPSPRVSGAKEARLEVVEPEQPSPEGIVDRPGQGAVVETAGAIEQRPCGSGHGDAAVD